MAMKPPTYERRPVGRLLVRQADEQEADRDREDARAEEVEVAASRRLVLIVGRSRQMMYRLTSPIGQVDVEDPVPADVVGQEAAEGGPDDERDPEHGAEQALVLAALGRREQVADDRERDREERAGADALDAPEQDELAHVLAQAGQRRTDEEQRRCRSSGAACGRRCRTACRRTARVIVLVSR